VFCCSTEGATTVGHGGHRVGTGRGRGTPTPDSAGRLGGRHDKGRGEDIRQDQRGAQGPEHDRAEGQNVSVLHPTGMFLFV